MLELPALRHEIAKPKAHERLTERDKVTRTLRDKEVQT